MAVWDEREWSCEDLGRGERGRKDEGRGGGRMKGWEGEMEGVREKGKESQAWVGGM